MIFSKYLITGDSSGKIAFWDIISEIELIFKNLLNGSENLKLVEWLIQEFGSSTEFEVSSLISNLNLKLCFYSNSEISNISSLISFETHASGVNCIALDYDNEGNYIIFSGGDDQSVSLLKFAVVVYIYFSIYFYLEWFNYKEEPTLLYFSHCLC